MARAKSSARAPSARSCRPSPRLDDFMKKQQDCCEQILKRLDKLDDILAAVKNLQGENDKLRGEFADLRNQQNALRDQVDGLPSRSTEQQTQTVAHNEAQAAAQTAVDEAQRRNKKYSLVSINVGPTFGAGRAGNASVTRARPVLLAIRRRRHPRRAGAGRVHVLSRAGRKASSISVWSTAGATCRPARSAASSTSTSASIRTAAALAQGSFLAGLPVQPRPHRRVRHPAASRTTRC